MPILTALVAFSLFMGAGVTAMPAHASAPAPSLPSYSLALTGYNAVPAQTDGNPLETASGAYSNPEVVAARSQDLADELPFGTIVEISGPSSDQEGCGYSYVQDEIGYRVIADTMNVRFAKRVDVLFTTTRDYRSANGMENAAEVMGICKGVTVRVVGFVDISNPAKLPKTQAALAALVSGNSLALK